ncbi:unnamed protein product [Medioppia subpectinata]|uniref:Superoxide dismutase n=1 Tax=Medioppia subpectinata TaxID=1979941 RepID=A0A7R9KMH1_9ACAR|nr:unnamed protein product [Medioppia subpectinata]CAG2105251.1 unnamed protein product [Medioppia subpectinata]
MVKLIANMSCFNALRQLSSNVRKCGVLARSGGMVGVRDWCRGKHTLPDLPYDYNALEPVISAEIMQLHHQKHHQTYVNNLNVAQEKLHAAINSKDVSAQIALEPVLRFNGGGHINHSIFWQNLSPKGGGEPEGDLLVEIKGSFTTFEKMKSEMSVVAAGVQGSGWAWLGYCPKTQKLRIASCVNQDPLFATTGLVPLLGIDVWEHAYYLQYKNVRPDYVKAIWNVVHWKDVEERLRAAKAL